MTEAKAECCLHCMGTQLWTQFARLQHGGAGAPPRQLGVKDAPVLAEGGFVKQKWVACCGGRAWPGPPGLGSIAEIVGAISRAPTACSAWPRDGALITV